MENDPRAEEVLDNLEAMTNEQLEQVAAFFPDLGLVAMLILQERENEKPTQAN